MNLNPCLTESTFYSTTEPKKCRTIETMGGFNHDDTIATDTVTLRTLGSLYTATF